MNNNPTPPITSMQPYFHFYFGSEALSAFREQHLLANIKAIIPQVTAVSAQKIYFVQVDNELMVEQSRKLETILKTQPCASSVKTRIISIPRIGTQSPWSSKTLDILHHCGLNHIQHVERGIVYFIEGIDLDVSAKRINELYALLHDPLTESIINSPEEAQALFIKKQPGEVCWINILEEGLPALEKINRQLGLALSSDEMDYLYSKFCELKRNPSDAELMMFAQANSEHCRHKIFNAKWMIDGQETSKSLFSMIRNTHANYSENVLSAYADNAAVIAGKESAYFFPDTETQVYQYQSNTWDIVMKVETHNHPTAIAPHPGAATGVGGEIRDEAAVGQGAKSRAGLCGYTVSNLHIPDFIRPWEEQQCESKPENLASALQIMLEAPLGAAAFGNEYGRPQITGYFRTFEMPVNEQMYGYHKPILIAGGMGQIRRDQIQKKTISPSAPLIVLGGPAMKIGLGGGAASSMASGESDTKLDFASVQRSNPEMQRRCQEVIDRCFALGKNNPIVSIHDVGAGGLSNALSELVHQSGLGAKINLRAIPNVEPSMTPLAIWCNEAQERYVLALNESDLAVFSEIADRERCPYAVMGYAQEVPVLTVTDAHFNNNPIDLPMSLLFDHTPKMVRKFTPSIPHPNLPPQGGKEQLIRTGDIELLAKLADAAERVLTLPCVASKQFLITIADRSVGGLVARDQMVGPWQVPVADVGVIATDFQSYHGSAMSMGERPISAIFNPKASVRMAIAEAITNIAAASITQLSDIKLSANWMAACGTLAQDSALYHGVWETGMNFCTALNLCIPVGKDSLSMKTIGNEENVISPLSLIISAFAPVEDVRSTLTPMLRRSDKEEEDTRLILIDLGHAKNRLGASAFAQVFKGSQEYAHFGDPADIDNPQDLNALFSFIQTLNQQQKILAYHDRSDGGLFACLCEMAFAGHTGITIKLDDLGEDPKAILFNEEIGAVIQIRAKDEALVYDSAERLGLKNCLHTIGRLNDVDRLSFTLNDKEILGEDRTVWQKKWHETSYRIQKLRDNPESAEQELALIANKADPGLTPIVTFDIQPIPLLRRRPPIMILREQGVNGQTEMAAAFDRAGFAAVDIHMSDILEERLHLQDFYGLVACGGFSYGDVLGAGRGWANTILHHPRTLEQFQTFFNRPDTFALGVCNGCQMLVQLKNIIPGAEHWPIFTRNTSEQFEARLSLVQIEHSPSWFFERMKGSQLPIVVSHGEGRAFWESEHLKESALNSDLITMRYLDHHGKITEHYPENPNGSPEGCAGLTSNDGRFNVMMPHPERVFRSIQMSWHPDDWEAYSPWMEMFMSVRRKY